VSGDQSIWFDECSGGSVEAIISASLYNIIISSNNIYFEYRQKPYGYFAVETPVSQKGSL
jgi:hypothetical protein